LPDYADYAAHVFVTLGSRINAIAYGAPCSGGIQIWFQTVSADPNALEYQMGLKDGLETSPHFFFSAA
jgi:hypothetical protein